MLHRRIAFLWPVVAALSMPAFADPDKDESGHGHRGHDREDKEEYWDGDCRVEHKWEKNGEYEEERKCERRGGRRHGSDPAPAVIAYPPWIVVQQGEPTYRRGYEPARPRGDVFQCHRDEVGQVLGGIMRTARQPDRQREWPCRRHSRRCRGRRLDRWRDRAAHRCAGSSLHRPGAGVRPARTPCRVVGREQHIRPGTRFGHHSQRAVLPLL